MLEKMRNIQRVALLFISSSLVLASCAERGTVSHTVGGSATKMITEKEALELATKELVANGLAPDDFATSVQSGTSNEWVVLFEPKGEPRIPGGGFWASVEKSTGSVYFKAGD